MKKNMYVLALSTILGVTSAIGAPQQIATTAQQDQATQTDTARAHGKRQADPQRQVERLTKRLQLTNEQQSQLLPILSQRAEQAKAIRNDTSLSATDRRAKMRDLHQESETQIKNVLTDTQKQQYDSMKQEARNHMKRHRAGTGSAS